MKMKSFVQLADNQQIAYQVYGQGDQTLILYHGLVGGSWLSNDAISAIESANVTVYAIERLGYGSSSKGSLDHVGQWQEIIKTFVNHLDITKADVIGISAGAPYAYATASALGDRVNHLWILCGVPAVYEASILSHYSPDNQKAYKQFLIDDISVLQDQYLEQMNGALSYFKQGNIPYIVKTLEEIIDHKCFGMARESQLQITPWGINLSEIKQAVHYLHATEDEMIPIEAAKKMSEQMHTHDFRELDISGEDVHMNTSVLGMAEVLNYYK
jgi:pimeloyl-ACP methyl ester carboxylesterase